MPELPEVEIVKQSLKKTIKSKKILKVYVKNRDLRFKVEKNFELKLINKKIKNILRKAKYLILEMEDNLFLLIHFGMSGTMHLVKKNKRNIDTNLSFYHSQTLPLKHNHIIIHFSKFKIIYNDPRRFGFFKIIETKKELESYLNKYGKEPLDKDFNYMYVKKKILDRKKNIKNILLDQNIISGIGNIYANEILFYSKINPKKIGSKLNFIEINKLIKFSKKVIKKAILRGGSSIRNFKNSNGERGSFQNEFKVYDKKDQLCPNLRCKKKIIKVNISNRSTFYCPYCQK